MTEYTPAWSTVKNTVAGKLTQADVGQKVVWLDMGVSGTLGAIDHNHGFVDLYIVGELGKWMLLPDSEVSVFYTFDESNDYGGRGDTMSRELALLMVWGCAAALVVAVVVGLIWNP